MINYLKRKNIVSILALAIFTLMPFSAFAALATDAVTVNGGSSVSIPYGHSINIGVTQTLSGGTNWRSVKYTVSDTGPQNECADTPNHTTNGTYLENFTSIQVLNSPGTYDLRVRGNSVNTCNGGQDSPVFVLTDAVTVTKADQQITFAGISDKVYGASDFSLFATVSSLSPTPASGLPITFSTTGPCSVTGSTVSITGAGVCEITASQSGDTNYNPAPDVVQSFTIIPKVLTPTSTVMSKIYDGTDNADVMVSLSGIVGSDDVAATATGTYNDRNVGSGKIISISNITLGGADAGNYSLSTTTDTLNTGEITVLPVTVTSQFSSKIYDGNTISPVMPLWGVIGAGDTPTFNQAYVSKTAGTMKQVFSGGTILDGNGGANYSLSFVDNNSSEILKKELTVSGVFAENKVYDGTSSAVINTAGAVLTGIVPGDTVSLDWSGLTASFDDSSAGVAKPVTITGLSLAGADAGNYELATISGLSADIAPAPVSVTGDFARPNKVYDGTNQAAFRTNIANMNIVLLGVFGGDDVELDQSGAIGTMPHKNVGTDIPVSFSGFALSGADAGNYELIAQPSDETQNVNPRSIVFSGVQDSKVYDGTVTSTQTPAITSGSVAVGDSYTAIQTFLDKYVGTGKTLDVSVTMNDGNGGANYSASWTDIYTGEIKPYPLTVTVEAQDRIYDGTTNVDVTLLDDRIAGDNITLNYVTAKFGGKNARPDKTATVTGITVSGPDSGNYIVPSSATDYPVAVTPLPLVINAEINDKVYDGNTNAGPVSYTAEVLPGDSISTITWGPANFDTKDVGVDKTVTFVPSIVPGLLDNRNYELPAVVTALADITPRTLTVTATGDTKEYDGTPNATATFSDNRVAGDDITVEFSSANFNSADIGVAIPIEILGLSLTGIDSANYTVAPDSLSTTGDIIPTGITVTADNQTKEIGEPDPELTYLPNTLLGSSMFTGMLERDAGEELGDYPITVGTLDAGPNYVMSFVDGVLTITKKSQTITIEPIPNKDFGEPDFPIIASATSMLPLNFTATPGICSVAGDSVHILQLGQCTLTATQTGDAVYAPAPSAMTSFMINDVSAPVLTINGPNPTTLEVITGTYIELEATSMDNHFSGMPVVTITGSVDVNTVGTYEITYSATDDYGNTGTAIRTVHVVDTQKPVITLIGDENVTVLTGDEYTELGANVTDNYDTLIIADIGGSVDTNTPGAYIVTYNAVDSSGNHANEVTRTVTVNDADAPVFMNLTNITVDATGPSGAIVNYNTVQVTDVNDGVFDATCEPQAGDTFPVGVTTVLCEATNSHDKTSTASFTVTVVDNGNPEITAPETQTFEATGPITTPDLVLATATDIVDSDVEVTYNPDSFALGEHTVTWTATDDSDNTATTISTVIIVDTSAPTIEEHLDVYAIATDSNGAIVEYTAPNAIDLVDGSFESICTPTSGSVFAKGSTTVTCSATDESENTAEETTFTVFVTDEGAPVITLNGLNTVTIFVGSSYTDAGATVTDDVDTDIEAVVTGIVNTSVVGEYTLTYNATDSSMNEAVPVTRTVIVKAQPSSSGGGGGSFIPTSSGSITLVETPEIAELITDKKTVCPITTQFWDIGERGEEVKNIKLFLNEYEGEKLPITNLYNLETFQAVKRFQVKYAKEILEPWDLSLDEATGFWYLSTSRQAKVLAGCNPAPVTLPNGFVLEN